jgi:hypothetical protein
MLAVVLRSGISRTAASSLCCHEAHAARRGRPRGAGGSGLAVVTAAYVADSWMNFGLSITAGAATLTGDSRDVAGRPRHSRRRELRVPGPRGRPAARSGGRRPVLASAQCAGGDRFGLVNAWSCWWRSCAEGSLRQGNCSRNHYAISGPQMFCQDSSCCDSRCCEGNTRGCCTIVAAAGTTAWGGDEPRKPEHHCAYSVAGGCSADCPSRYRHRIAGTS